MRILHILDHSLPLHSGYVFRTAAIVREQQRLGWETFHLTSGKQGASPALTETVDGLHFFRTPLEKTAWAGWPVLNQIGIVRGLRRRLTAVIELLRPDLLHAHSPALNGLAALPIARRYRLPLVYEMRASWEDAAVDHGTTTEGSLRYRLSRALETHVLCKSTQITTICEGLRQDILSRGIDPAKVTVIPNAVQVEQFHFGDPPDQALRAELGLTGATVVGFIGSFYGYEGLDLLLAAIARLADVRPELRVLLVGGGFQEQALHNQAQTLGIADRVVFTGRVPHDQVNRYYDLIDVLAYPRHRIRLTDLVTPLKPLEAMAQGRIFVASDVGGHRELIRDGETGFLFPAGDAAALAATLERVLAARADWPRLAAQARQFVEQERTWVSSVSRYRQVYAAALGQPALPVVAELE
jgi:PEP-CTERM/exosortase A-associated glycosyltransferase